MLLRENSLGWVAGGHRKFGGQLLLLVLDSGRKQNSIDLETNVCRTEWSLGGKALFWGKDDFTTILFNSGPIAGVTAFIYLFTYYWNIVDFQCCANLCYTTKWYTLIYILFLYSLLHGLPQDIEYRSLCYTVGPCLSILNAIVYQPQIPSPSLFHFSLLSSLLGLLPLNTHPWLVSNTHRCLVSNRHLVRTLQFSSPSCFYSQFSFFFFASLSFLYLFLSLSSFSLRKYKSHLELWLWGPPEDWNKCSAMFKHSIFKPFIDVAFLSWGPGKRKWDYFFHSPTECPPELTL